MKYLVDTNVLSEPTKSQPVAEVVNWLATNEVQIAVNPIILGELEFGILAPSIGKRRALLAEWFARGAGRLRVLDFDAQTASCWAQLLAELKKKGKSMPLKDSLIAASARQYQLTLVTRNTNDYKYTGVEVLNPFKSNERKAR